MNGRGSWLVAAVLLAATNVAGAQYSIPPTNLTGVNTAYVEGSPSLSADALTLYFSSNRPGGQGSLDLWQATRADVSSPFGGAVNLGATLNGSSTDTHPWISTDGLSLLFASSRAGGQGNYDLWTATRAAVGDAFGAPLNLGPTVNTSYRESRPCLSADGLDLYFTTNRPGGQGDYDLWVASRGAVGDPFGAPANLGPGVNTPYREGGAGISADGLTLYLNSDQPGGVGGEDLYVADRPTLGDSFAGATNLGVVINSTARDNAAAISADGTLLVFMSIRPGGAGDEDLWMTPVPEPATMGLLAIGAVGVLRRRRRA